MKSRKVSAKKLIAVLKFNSNVRSVLRKSPRFCGKFLGLAKGLERLFRTVAQAYVRVEQFHNVEQRRIGTMWLCGTVLEVGQSSRTVLCTLYILRHEDK